VVAVLDRFVGLERAADVVLHDHVFHEDAFFIDGVGTGLAAVMVVGH